MKRGCTAMCLAAVLTVTASTGTLALEKNGVTFPDTVDIQGTDCTLMGVGVRKKLIINVYLGALYLSHPTTSPAQVISTDQVKRVVMHFLYKEVEADQLNEAWDEGFANNTPDSVTALADEIARFKGFFTESLKKGERVEITYSPGTGTEVAIKGVSRGTIPGREFMEALFAVWFGPKPPSGGLKDGMLGD